MAQEKERGCGFRKAGGLYLCGEGLSLGCGRLPIPIKTCPVCGEGLRIARGYRWIDGPKFIGSNCTKGCDCHQVACPICFSSRLGQCLLMSVGKKFYTPKSFIKESVEMGVSKRIGAIPKGLELGKTWVLLAHPEAGEIAEENNKGELVTEKCPAIFYAFRPTRVEKLLKKGQVNEKLIVRLKKRGITPVILDGDDEDHEGDVYTDLAKKKAQKRLEGYIDSTPNKSKDKASKRT